MLKKTLIILLGIISISLFGYYTFVFSGFYKDFEINYIGNISGKIYQNSKNLKGDLVIFKSSLDISNYNIYSLCKIKSKFLFYKDNIYVFSYKFLDYCSNENLYLKDEKGNIIYNSNFKVEFVNDYDLYNKYTDVDDINLNKILNKSLETSKKMDSLKGMKIILENLDLYKKLRKFNELDYLSNIVKNILQQRQNKYNLPIIGYSLPYKNINKLPNGLRPYRASYTNGIHEGWDIDAPLGTEVVSIDSGIIVKIVRDFKFSDLNNLKKGKSISYTDKFDNLDVLRGNQVWLKTMKGDVIFYSHLSLVYDDINVGNIVSKGYPLGKVGKTGVPDKDYDDYHLHFELRKNPYIISEAGKYSLYDYMNWDWYFKGGTREYIRENQYSIFEK